MDCITFNKMIGPYLREELSDEDLNEFLQHLAACPQCNEELEINYIVGEGMERLDRDRSDYNLSDAYRTSKEESRRYLQGRKHLIRFSYVVDTVSFWALLMAAFVFLRILFTGA